MTKMQFDFNPFADITVTDISSNKINNTNVAILKNKYDLSLMDVDNVTTEVFIKYGKEATLEQLEQLIIDLYADDTDVDNIEVVKGYTEPNEGTLFPLNTHKSILQDKNYPYNTYANMVIVSNFNKYNEGEYKNYIYADGVSDIMERFETINKSGKKLMSEKTLNRHIKAMEKHNIQLLKLSNTKNGIVYHLKSSENNRYYVEVPYKQIKELLDATNKNMLKLFTLLKYMCNENTFTTIDRKFLCENIGLSVDSDNNLKSIGTMTKALAKLGMIEINQHTKIEVNEDGTKYPKTINSYRIRTFEEYLDIDNKAVNKK